MTSYLVRRVRPEDWRPVMALRLKALRDPVAHLAFLEQLDEALKRPEGAWRDQARSCATGRSKAQFIAADDRGALAGTVTVLVTSAGELDYIGETSDQVGAAIVGVYVDPAHRGAGLIQQLLSEAHAWLNVNGVRQVRLHVNEANTRARGAYLKCGYIDTGVRVDMVDGINHEMVHSLSADRLHPPPI